MQQSDYDSFVQLVNGMAELYGKPMSPVALALWWNALQPYDLIAVRQGLSRHMQNPDTGQFMPKPADVIKFIGGTTQDGALLAWAKVDKAVRSVGTYRSVAFDDPIIHAVITDMGGWVALGSKDEHEWPFVAKEFENRYRGYRQRDLPSFSRWLVGIAESSNSQLGMRVEPPVLIGDTEKAKRIMQNGSNTPAIGFTQASEADMSGIFEPVAQLGAA